MMIPREDGPKASSRISDSTDPIPGKRLIVRIRLMQGQPENHERTHLIQELGG